MLAHRRGGRRAFLKSAWAAGAFGVLGLAGWSDVCPKRHARLTAHDFSDLIGARFQVEHQPGHWIAAKLIEVNRLKNHGNPKSRKPFSQVFDLPGSRRYSTELPIPRTGHRDMVQHTFYQQHFFRAWYGITIDVSGGARTLFL
jgi:hypothetical protein